MARVLGYGGIANTNGARDFSTKTESAGEERLHGGIYLVMGTGTFCFLAAVLVAVRSVL